MSKKVATKQTKNTKTKSNKARTQSSKARATRTASKCAARLKLEDCRSNSRFCFFAMMLVVAIALFSAISANVIIALS